MENKNAIEKYLYKKIINKPVFNIGDNEEHVLSDQEAERLKKIERYTMLRAASAGALGVILLYVPYHLWGSWMFPKTKIWLPIYNDYLDVEISFLIYSLVLVIMEIAYLTYNNIHTVKDTAHACDYPNPDDPHYETNINSLIAVGLEKNIKNQSQIGINPFAGLSKWKVLLFTVVNLAKAAMTNFLMKLVIKRMLGRYALRILVDLAGIPVYAFWNAFAARYVARESRVRIMANPIIKKFATKLYEEQKDNKEFIEDLYYMLDYVAITKRKFHGNHYLLALVTLKQFGIEPDPNHQYDKAFIERMKTASELTIQGFSKINLLGMALDGRISKKEELMMYQWRKKGIYIFSEEETKNATREFFEGEGEISIL